MIHLQGSGCGSAGTHVHLRNFAAALHQVCPVALTLWDKSSVQNLSEPYATMLGNTAKWKPNQIGIGIGVPGDIPKMTGCPTIAYVTWETTRIPQRERRFFDQCDRIWVPSNWLKKILEENGLKRNLIDVVPEGVDTDRFRPRSGLRNEDGRYRFLFVGKQEVRKGIDLLIHAYCLAFDRDDDVELVLRCSSYRAFGGSLKQLLLPAQTQGLNVVAIPHQDASNIPRLYNMCDAFVTATRAEAWGLPLIEAMASALPVIAPDYSGYRDFLDEDSAYLVEVANMVRAQDASDFGDDVDYGKWAEVDVEDLAKKMRWVFENRGEAAHRGAHARQKVKRDWQWTHSANKAMDVLSEIGVADF